MKVLVTGGAGFLGRHVVRRLAADGFDVTAFDSQPVTDDVRSVSADLLDSEAVEKAVDGQDVVCHIGAIGDVYLAAADPRLAAAVNVTGTANVGEAARKAGARVVYASTWEVYGLPEWEPIDEAHPCSPDHPYSITKLAGERMLLAADHLSDVPTLALRLGTAFGSGLRTNSVFRLFIDRARRREPITIMGDGSQARQFTHATDIARSFSLACRSELRGLALNTVADEAISIKQLAEAVISRLPTELVFAPARPGDVPPALVSSAKIKELLGWEPLVSFDEGVAELIDQIT
ncbi:MAG: NAD-dependent epimerase/dehydratase family protein [Acidimicrobiia bacterium]